MRDFRQYCPTPQDFWQLTLIGRIGVEPVVRDPERASGALLPLLSNGGGDVLAARDCAELLLGEQPEPSPSLGAARLILTAVCLHLHPVAGPDPTLADLQACLTALAHPGGEIWEALSRSSMALVQYASCDFNGGRGRRAQDALSLAIQAVKAKLHTEV